MSIKLTAREVEVVVLVCQAKTNKSIGATLDISAETVKRHLSTIFVKWGCKNRVDLALLAVERGIAKI